jgi:hypothetical protein
MAASKEERMIILARANKDLADSLFLLCGLRHPGWGTSERDNADLQRAHELGEAALVLIQGVMERLKETK